MLTPIANIHRSKLPPPGAIVTMPGLPRFCRRPRPGHMTVRPVRFRVVAYNLTDAADPRYSRGIHLVRLERLADRAPVTVAGHWCCDDEVATR